MKNLVSEIVCVEDCKLRLHRDYIKITIKTKGKDFFVLAD